MSEIPDWTRESGSAPLDLRIVVTREKPGISVTEFTFATESGGAGRRAASIIRPSGAVSEAPVILYVHWYEPSACDSNRTQFESEAEIMARKGAVCLLPETMWSDRDWFIKRTQQDDVGNSTKQTNELRCSLDLLLAQPGVSSDRLAYVGHDFGAMYGVLLGSTDPRPCAYALMAATPRFSDWYLYYPRLEEPERGEFISQMAPYDPIAHIRRLAPAPVYFQFATEDPHVPEARARAFYEAASEPKKVDWYDAGHGLNEQAREDRIAWLTRILGL